MINSASFQSLPDILAMDLKVVFCGINPGARAAAAGHHFVGRGNRFWRVLHLAGFTSQELRPENDRAILKYCCGLTTAVERPTARAAELSSNEFVAGSVKLAQKIERYAPRYIAFLGKAAYSAISHQRKVAWGPQPGVFGAAAVWVLPNPSGLNRGFSLDDLVRAYRQLYLAACCAMPGDRQPKPLLPLAQHLPGK
ncbi:G/U mismatch-specific DNA glycosylase [Pollutimonas bauzanensis]|uniref:G/U mismatch-specific uracil-DNA glycosylase n=1 Tax=Pollutimonas bauzanensis TaxID=658167 RepID=A0A1M5Z991_9BURK|nr:G/U mismatch-specific DNA glycosylase [Pollutimonas bauzanensis]SHI20790.1 G/U mismatch-specific uracil-DNA glycosylase [Pollutimonas bauzanensis]